MICWSSGFNDSKRRLKMFTSSADSVWSWMSAYPISWLSYNSYLQLSSIGSWKILHFKYIFRPLEIKKKGSGKFPISCPPNNLQMFEKNSIIIFLKPSFYDNLSLYLHTLVFYIIHICSGCSVCSRLCSSAVSW